MKKFFFICIFIFLKLNCFCFDQEDNSSKNIEHKSSDIIISVSDIKHQSKLDEPRCSLFRLNSAKRINMLILDKLNSQLDRVKLSNSEKESLFEVYLPTIAFLFFYDDDKCNICRWMRSTLQDFMLKYEDAFVCSINVLNFDYKNTSFDEFNSLGFEIFDKSIFEWVKPLPSVLLYDSMSDDAIFITNHLISFEEFEYRVLNYIIWAYDKVELYLFSKFEFMKILEEKYFIDCNDYYLFYHCFALKQRDLFKIRKFEDPYLDGRCGGFIPENFYLKEYTFDPNKDADLIEYIKKVREETKDILCLYDEDGEPIYRPVDENESNINQKNDDSNDQFFFIKLFIKNICVEFYKKYFYKIFKNN